MSGRLFQTPFPYDGPDERITPEPTCCPLPSYLFARPAVAEVVGAGFDCPPNTQYLTLRFPRIVKLHHDRSVDEIVSFAEYQDLARSSVEKNYGHIEYGSWLYKLDFDGDEKLDQSTTTSQSSVSSEVDSEDISGAETSHNVSAGVKRQAETSVSPSAADRKHECMPTPRTVEDDVGT